MVKLGLCLKESAALIEAVQLADSVTEPWSWREKGYKGKGTGEQR